MRLFRCSFIDISLGICLLGFVLATRDVPLGTSSSTLEASKLVVPVQDNLKGTGNPAEQHNCPSMIQVDLLRLSYDYSHIDIDIIQHVKVGYALFFSVLKIKTRKRAEKQKDGVFKK